MSLEEVIRSIWPAPSRRSPADDVFGLPRKRAYPMPDANQARRAKARAVDDFHRGDISLAEWVQIDRKADKILSEAAETVYSSKSGQSRAR